MEKQRTRHIRIIKKEGERQRGGKTLVVGSQRKALAPWEVGGWYASWHQDRRICQAEGLRGRRESVALSRCWKQWLVLHEVEVVLS